MSRAAPLLLALLAVGGVGAASPAIADGGSDPVRSVLFPAETSLSQPPDETINRTYGGPGNQTARDVAVGDDGYALAGYTFDGTDTGAWLAHVDGHGTLQWTQTYGGAGDQRAFAVLAVEDGYLLAGSTDHGGDRDAWLAKVGPDGNEQWTRTYGGDGSEAALGVARAVDGEGYLLAGYTNSTGEGEEDAWLVRVSSVGNQQWTRTVGFGRSDAARDVAQTENGYVFVGYTNVSRTDGLDAWVVKTNREGEHQTSAVYGGDGHDTYWSVEPVDSGYLIAGETSSYGAGSFDAWLQRTDDDLRRTLNVTIGGDEAETGLGAAPTDDGYVLVGGTAHGSGGSDALMVGLTSDGAVIWSKIVGGERNEIAWTVQRTSVARVVAGEAGSFDAAGQDAWLLRLGSAPPQTTSPTEPNSTVTDASPGSTDTTDGTADGPGADSPVETTDADESGTAAGTGTTTTADGPGFGALVGGVAAVALVLWRGRRPR